MVGVIAAVAANAQGGNRLRIVVPYPAGGTQDAMIRTIQEPLGQALGTSIYIDNRAGAAGMIGAQEVKQAAPDGNTLLLFNNGMVISPLVQKGIVVDFTKDFTPVTTMAEGPMVIFTNASLPVKTLPELIAYAKAQPEGVTFGSTGTGGLGHLTMESFARQVGIRVNHVPYRGNAPLMLAVMAGEVPVAIGSVSDSTLQSVQTGKIRALAVTTRQVSPTVPGVPAISSIVPGFGVPAIYAFLAPPGTPPAVVQRIRDAVAKVMDQPDIRTRYLSYGNVVKTGSGKDLSDMIASEATNWKAVVQATGIHSD